MYENIRVSPTPSPHPPGISPTKAGCVMSYKQIRDHFKDFQTVCEPDDLNLDSVTFGYDLEHILA